jgi:tripartite-type tricarboxylate transporter receptor subunit TctC
MKVLRRQFLQAYGLGALVFLSCSAPAWSQAEQETWPNRVVRLVVGFPPGGGADLAARIVANGLSDKWGRQVVVENKPGAGARIALDTVAHAPPDGYTVLFAAGAPEVNRFLFSKLTFDPVADLAPVSLVGTFPDIIAVPNSSPFNTLGELIAYAKANPGKLNWASPGIGTVPHLAGELFKRMAGIDITHVPYRGVTEGLMSDFMSGRLDLMFNTTGSLLPPVEAHQVRGLAVTSAARYPGAPQLPTVAESGVPGYDVSSWYGLYVPAKTPAGIVKKLFTDMAVLLADPTVVEKFKPLGVVASASTPQQLAVRNAGDAARWGPIIAEANIKVE